MKLRLLVLLVPWFLWQCATPPPAGTPAPVSLGLDDDHRAVGTAEFLASAWKPLGAVGWKPVPQGAEVTLTDGRVATLSFVEPTLFRWWVPAAPGERPLSPAGRYRTSDVAVNVHEDAGVLTVGSPDLQVKLELKTLAWTASRGDKTVVRTAGGLRVAGRRLSLGFHLADAARWLGPGLGPAQATRHWVDPTHPFAVPALVGAGGLVPFAVAVDTGYQSYTALGADATVGTLNGGLDVLVSAAPQMATVVGSLTAVLGRPGLPPQWALGTALVLPASETGAFVRRARLSVETAAGGFRSDRPRFQYLALPPVSVVPDLTQTDVRTSWSHRDALVTLPGGAGVALGPSADRSDWNTTFLDQGQPALLARVGPRLPGLEAQAFSEASLSRAPLLRPFVLAASGAPGLARFALAEFRPTGADPDLDAVLALGLAGQGTPAVRLDLSGLAQAETRPGALGLLASWLWAPVLTLDWGPDPSAVWAGLSEGDRRTLKALLDRRSQLKPYLAQVVRDTASSGRPAWAPVWFNNPGDPKALAVHDEYLLGTSLLAAPGPTGTRSVYLPGPGVWFDFWTGEEYGGGKSYDVEVRPDRPLLFAPGGALVPVREPEVFDEKDVYNPLTVHVFPGGFGTGTYWADDGVSVGYQTGAYQETRLTYQYSQKTMTLDHEVVSSTARVRPDPYLLYRLHNVYKPRQVKIDGKAIPLFGDSWGITDTDRSAAWYESDHTLLIKTFHPEKDQTIEMVF